MTTPPTPFGLNSSPCRGLTAAFAARCAGIEGRRAVALLCGGLLLVAAGGATATPVPIYAQDFQSTVGTEWSSTTTSVTPTPYPFGERRFLGEFGRGDAVTLSLDALPVHDWVRLQFDLYVIRTWDGDSASTVFAYGNDRFRAQVVGAATPLIDASFSNGNPAGQSFGAQVSNAPMSGAAERYSLGYWFDDGILDKTYQQDAVYRIDQVFEHTAGSFGVEFRSFLDQAIGDESWGLDNVSVWLGSTAQAAAAEVPEPSSLALLAAAAAALGAAWRRQPRHSPH